MSELRVFTNGTDTVVAIDIADVQRVVESHYGVTFEQEGWSLDEWEEVPGNEPVKIRYDGAEALAYDIKTAADWAVSYGRGFLCSTEY